MLTKKDRTELVEELLAVFATKSELQKFREEMHDMRSELKNDILQFRDDILFEIKAMREELAVVIGYRQKIEDHEERITTLEQRKSFKKLVN